MTMCGVVGVGGWPAEAAGPGLLVGESVAGEVDGALVDELFAFVQGGVHVAGHRPGRMGDEADDESRALKPAVLVEPADGGVHAVVEDCGDVLGVVE